MEGEPCPVIPRMGLEDAGEQRLPREEHLDRQQGRVRDLGVTLKVARPGT